MAKVTGPLMSMDARNKFGGALVFTAWKGRNVVRQLVTPSNPQSTDQTAARNKVRVTGRAQAQVFRSLDVQSGQTLTDLELLKIAAPSGQAWNGYLTKQMIGTSDINYTAAADAWTALTSGQKTAWDDAAAARDVPFQAAAQQTSHGAAGTPVSPGEVYFHQQYAMFQAGIFTGAPTGTPPTYA